MNKILLCSALFSGFAFVSCSSDSSSNNLPSNEKFLSSMSVVSAQDASENTTLTVNYDTDGKVSSVTDGTESSVMVYDSNHHLTTITGDSDPLSISDLYQAPYDSYDIGEVLDYDNNGNPVKVRLFERDYDGVVIEEYEGDIYYDSQANPFLHTLNAAGILDVLDNVQLNFAAAPQPQELIAAKMLLPNNNPNRFVVKHLNGEVKENMVAQYVYDNTGYPTSATFTETNDDGIFVYTSTYNYLP